MNKKALNRKQLSLEIQSILNEVFQNNLTYDSSKSGTPSQHVIGESLYDLIIGTLTDGTSFGQKLETVCTKHIFPYLQEINSDTDVMWGYKNFPFGDAVCVKGNNPISGNGSNQDIVLYSIKATGRTTSTDSNGNAMVTSATAGTSFIGGTSGDIACQIIYDFFAFAGETPPTKIYPGGIFVTVSLPATAEIGFHGICLIVTKIDPSDSAYVDQTSVPLGTYADSSASPNPPTSSAVTTVGTWQSNIDNTNNVNTTYHVIYPSQTAQDLSEAFKDNGASNINEKCLKLYNILVGGQGAETALQMVDTKDNASILNRLNNALNLSPLPRGYAGGGGAGQTIRNNAVLSIRSHLRQQILLRLGGYNMQGATDPAQAAQVVNDKLPEVLEVLSKNVVNYLDKESLEELIGTDADFSSIGGGSIDFNVVVFSNTSLDDIESKLEDALADLKTLEYTAQGTQSTPTTQAQKDAFNAGLEGVPRSPRGARPRLKESKEYPYEIKLQDLLDVAVEVAVNFFEDLGFVPAESTEKKASWLDSLKGFGSDVAGAFGGAVDTAADFLDDLIGSPAGAPAIAENNHKKYSLLPLLEMMDGGAPNDEDPEDDSDAFGAVMERFMQSTLIRETKYNKIDQDENEENLSHGALLKKRYYGRY